MVIGKPLELDFDAKVIWPENAQLAHLKLHIIFFRLHLSHSNYHPDREQQHADLASKRSCGVRNVKFVYCIPTESLRYRPTTKKPSPRYA